MRTKFIIIAFITIIAATASCTTQSQVYSTMSDQGEVDFQLFYDQLSPYGQWIDYPEYGYVWLPDAGPDFAPYETNGYWVMTDYGWTWVSDYPWGWAPFHYGRWDFDGRLGWFWVPDNEWGPAWVSWRRAEGYYGWAPMRPGMRVGYYNDFGDPYRWHFVRDRDFGRPRIHRYELDHRDYDRLLRRSSVIDNTHIDRRRNTTYIAGPSPQEVQRVTGRRINSLAVRDNNRPGTVVSKDQVRIYRPQVQPSTRSAAPSRVYSRDQVNPGNRRNPQENIYLPDERRNEKMRQMESQRQIDQRQNQQRQIEQPQTRQRQMDQQRMNQQQQMERQQQIQQQQQIQRQQQAEQQQQQRQIQEQNSMTRRQQRQEQRRLEMEQRQQNSRSFGQQKRDEARQQRDQQIQQRDQQIQQQQAPQNDQQQPTPENKAPWGRRR